MITTHQKQGPREYQEDYFFTADCDATVIAVFDGHGGSVTARHCSERLGKLTLETARMPSVKDGLKSVCSTLAKECSCNQSGSTLSIVFISEKIATVAVIGDSPVLILDESGEINLSPEHNVRSNPESVREVVARGGQVFNGYAYHKGYGLQMSRAIGDSGMGNVISNEPDVYSVKLGPNSVVLVASDGVFDPDHEDKIRPLQIAQLLRNGANAEEIVKSAGMLQDNATAIVWRAS